MIVRLYTEWTTWAPSLLLTLRQPYLQATQIQIIIIVYLFLHLLEPPMTLVHIIGQIVVLSSIFEPLLQATETQTIMTVLLFAHLIEPTMTQCALLHKLQFPRIFKPLCSWYIHLHVWIHFTYSLITIALPF